MNSNKLPKKTEKELNEMCDQFFQELDKQALKQFLKENGLTLEEE